MIQAAQGSGSRHAPAGGGDTHPRSGGERARLPAAAMRGGGKIPVVMRMETMKRTGCGRWATTSTTSACSNHLESQAAGWWVLSDDKILQDSIASLSNVVTLQFPWNSVGKDLYGHISNFSDFAWSKLPEGQMAGTSDAFQTPGAVSNRLSIGTTSNIQNRKVTQERRDALIHARFTSWGLQRRKFSSY
ncbi:unnamed protein product [Urochloa humidicola]